MAFWWEIGWAMNELTVPIKFALHEDENLHFYSRWPIVLEIRLEAGFGGNSYLFLFPRLRGRESSGVSLEIWAECKFHILFQLITKHTFKWFQSNFNLLSI